LNDFKTHWNDFKIQIMDNAKMPPIKKTIWEEIKKKKRFVIKIGTNSLLERDGRFDHLSMAKLVKIIKQLLKAKKEVLLVSSGAISAGMRKMGLEQRPNDIVEQQVLAAIGNPLLIQQYNQLFETIPTAQVLVTQQDLSRRVSFIHFRDALERMLSMGVVPIINENDVLSVDELVGSADLLNSTEFNFSDNDVLSALITGAMKADVLIILSDVQGLYTKHPNSPKAEFIEIVPEIDEKIKAMGKAGSKGGRGGMKTKLLAAEIATKSGAHVMITSVKDEKLGDLLEGNIKSTLFLPNQNSNGRRSLADRVIWLLFATNAEGTIIVDKGATKALRNGASLLLPGIIEVQGKFVEREVVEIRNPDGENIAKGIANYSSKVIKERINMRAKGVLPKITFEIISHENMYLYKENE